MITDVTDEQQQDSGEVGFAFTFKGQINLFGLLPLC